MNQIGWWNTNYDLPTDTCNGQISYKLHLNHVAPLSRFEGPDNIFSSYECNDTSTYIIWSASSYTTLFNNVL